MIFGFRFEALGFRMWDFGEEDKKQKTKNKCKKGQQEPKETKRQTHNIIKYKDPKESSIL